jgi:ribonuclease P protein component
VTVAVPKEDSNAVFKRGKFPRNARLLRRADFERVYKQGRRHFSASMTVFYLSRGEQGTDARTEPPATVAQGRSVQGRPAPRGIRVGFTVGRALGGAVERNRMKRRLREAVRLTRPLAGADVDVVINPKKLVLATGFSNLLNEVGRVFEVIEQKVSGKSGLKSPAES